MGKIGPTALNFSYDMFLLIIFSGHPVVQWKSSCFTFCRYTQELFLFLHHQTLFLLWGVLVKYMILTEHEYQYRNFMSFSTQFSWDIDISGYAGPILANILGVQTCWYWKEWSVMNLNNLPHLFKIHRFPWNLSKCGDQNDCIYSNPLIPLHHCNEWLMHIHSICHLSYV